MPIRFQYIPVGSSEPIVLNRLDEMMCADLKIPVDEKKYCSMFQFLQYLGTSILIWGSKNGLGNGYETCKESVEAFIELGDADLDDEEKEAMRKYFYKEFTYLSSKSWR